MPSSSRLLIHADHSSQKRLGHWTTARAFAVRARRSSVVVDLRSPRLAARDLDLELHLDHATLKLLVADDAIVDQTELSWRGRGRLKQTFHAPVSTGGRRVRLAGQIRQGEIRVQSGGVARLSAMCSREYLADAWRSHRRGRVPTLDDPAGAGRSA